LARGFSCNTPGNDIVVGRVEKNDKLVVPKGHFPQAAKQAVLKEDYIAGMPLKGLQVRACYVSTDL
jgi:hypothetical protein